MSERIDQIRERLSRATPGPWDHIESTYRDRPVHRIGNPEINVDVALVWRWGDKLSLSTAEFIANAPDDVEWLLAEVERLKPRQVTTPEDLDALPIGSVVLDAQGDAWTKTDVGFWQCFQDFNDGGGLALIGPVTVLHEGADQ